MAREIARSGASCRTRIDGEGRGEPRPDEHGVFDAVTAIAFVNSARPQCRARTDRSAQSHRTAGLEVSVSRHISAVDVLDSSMTAMVQTSSSVCLRPQLTAIYAWPETAKLADVSAKICDGSGGPDSGRGEHRDSARFAEIRGNFNPIGGTLKPQARSPMTTTRVRSFRFVPIAQKPSVIRRNWPASFRSRRDLI